ncbi:hypothetical protein SRABI83_03118 [Arthrobacter sp. Bi83]|uniref:hypothetical protein n=1 Tax=Arthrobacter sp. Bi83 TaxID=2822353 RepID=UPI001DE1BCA2|nr:hypothetical protein SRABI83_03118 [Arthrobacter sp. Bi83]
MSSISDCPAEVACVLTVSESAASALLYEASVLTAGLQMTPSALQAGSISWQHARIVADETMDLGTAWDSRDCFSDNVYLPSCHGF